MSHPLTASISEIEFLQERIREKNARIEALEAALREIAAAHGIGGPAMQAIARAALAPERR